MLSGLIGDSEIDEAESEFLCGLGRARLARRAFSFSSRCALNMNSNGESRAAGDGEVRDGVGMGVPAACDEDTREGVDTEVSTVCEEGSVGCEVADRPRPARVLTLGDSTPLDKKLGSGSDDGAGDAWNVAPAKAFATPGFGIEAGWEAWRVVRAESGDTGRFLGRVLSLPPRLAEGWSPAADAGAGDDDADF